MGHKNAIVAKSYKFSMRIIKLYKFLIKDKKEFLISLLIILILRCASSIVNEAQFTESKPDITHKMGIALKNNREAEYRLHLLKDSGYITSKSFNLIANDNSEVKWLLSSIILTSKESISKIKKTNHSTFCNLHCS